MAWVLLFWLCWTALAPVSEALESSVRRPVLLHDIHGGVSSKRLGRRRRVIAGFPFHRE
eukprot:COSAG05_NODE_20601_length_278_cov_0.581006_2_plen_58_part_01